MLNVTAEVKILFLFIHFCICSMHRFLMFSKVSWKIHSPNMILISLLKLKSNLLNSVFPELFQYVSTFVFLLLHDFCCHLMGRGECKLGPRFTCFIISFSSLRVFKSPTWSTTYFLVFSVYAFSLSSICMIGKSRASFFEFVCSLKTHIRSGYPRNPFPRFCFVWVYWK